MSLVGNLEDLGLGEILQIVSLSHKSGILTLQSAGRQGIIVFRKGQVIRATTNQGRRFLGELLVEQGMLDETRMQQALLLQQERGFRDRIGTILTQNFNISAEQIEAVARRHVEQVVYSLFTWQEGSFEFELEDNLETVDAIRDPLQFILSQGLNPQFLAMEGSRIFDELRHRQQQAGDDGTQLTPVMAVEPLDTEVIQERVDLAFDIMREPVARDADGQEPAPFQWDVVLVDDDEDTREFLGQTLRSLGFEVVACDSSEAALITIDTRYRQQGRPLVLVDLIMPSMDGSGILGGLELLELLRNNFPELTVLAVSDYQNSDAERRLRELGYSLLLKPKRSELADPDIIEDFTQRLQSSLAASSSGSLTNRPGAGVNLGDEIRLELGEAPVHSETEPVTSTGISLLRGILEELINPSLGGGVILLALRFASEFMNRAVIFTVKEHEVVGLGQFGINPVVGMVDERLRTLRIPRNESSLFSEVFRSLQPCKLHPPLGRWNEQLFGLLGGGIPYEVFLGPIISDNEVVAILYGDNLPETKPIGDTDSLEIFLSQAGMVTEKALMLNRLKEKSPEGT
ncbi:MAG TPA: response regulator [Geobacteraceae bacterium]